MTALRTIQGDEGDIGGRSNSYSLRALLSGQLSGEGLEPLAHYTRQPKTTPGKLVGASAKLAVNH